MDAKYNNISKTIFLLITWIRVYLQIQVCVPTCHAQTKTHFRQITGYEGTKLFFPSRISFKIFIKSSRSHYHIREESPKWILGFLVEILFCLISLKARMFFIHEGRRAMQIKDISITDSCILCYKSWKHYSVAKWQLILITLLGIRIGVILKYFTELKFLFFHQEHCLKAAISCT